MTHLIPVKTYFLQLFSGTMSDAPAVSTSTVVPKRSLPAKKAKKKGKYENKSSTKVKARCECNY